MIESTVYFDNDIELEQLVKSLTTLPELIRPFYFSENEGKIITNRLADEVRFQDFIKENSFGFFLYAENRTCIDISMPTVGYKNITLYLAEGLPGELAVALFYCVADYRPIFGYACEYCEYKHRNRHYISIRENHIESWIGRKLENYIPGLYWHTLLSDKLLAQHNVELSVLINEAITSEVLGGDSLYLLKFFEKPEEWKNNASHLDDLCEKIEGIFSRRPVEIAAAEAASFFEYREIIAKWR